MNENLIALFANILAKVNPAKSVYEPKQRLKKSLNPNKSVLLDRFSQEKWTLEDPSDPNDILLKVLMTGFEQGSDFKSKEEAEKALEAFKAKKMFEDYVLVPSDVWFLAESQIRNKFSKLTDTQVALKALEIAKKEMGWSDYNFEPKAVPSDTDIQKELKRVLQFIPACFIEEGRKFALRIADANTSEAISTLRHVESELSRYLGASVTRVPSKQRNQVSKIARQLLDIEQEAVVLATLTGALAMEKTSKALLDFRREVCQYRSVAQQAVIVAGYLPETGDVLGTLETTASAFDSLELVLLDSIRASGEKAIPSWLGENELRLSHLVFATDLAEDPPGPSPEEEKLLSLALELGMDAKYQSREELVRDLAYILRGMGCEVDLASKEGQEKAAGFITAFCQQVDADVSESLREHLLPSYSELSTLVIRAETRLADVPPVFEDMKADKAEIEQIIKDLAVGTRAKADDLLIQWDYDTLTLMDRVTRTRMCKALVTICQKYSIEPRDFWIDMIEHPEIYDARRSEELVLPLSADEAPTIKLLDLVAL